MLLPRRDPELLRALRDLKSSHMDAGYRRRLKMIRELDLRKRLPELRVPVALFASVGDQVVPSVAAARVMERALKDVTLEELPGCGHVILPCADQPWVERLVALQERAEATPRGTCAAS